MKYVWMSLCFLVGAVVGGYVVRSSNSVELQQDVVVMTRDQKAIALAKGAVLRKDKWGEHYYVEVELDKTKVKESDRELDRFTDVVQDALVEADFKIVPASAELVTERPMTIEEEIIEAEKAKLDAMNKKMIEQGAEYSELFNKFDKDSE